MVEIRKNIVNPFEEAKKERLVWLMKYLETRQEAPYLQILSILQTRYGISEDTAKQYVRVLINSGSFENQQGIIVYKVNVNAMQ